MSSSCCPQGRICVTAGQVCRSINGGEPKCRNCSNNLFFLVEKLKLKYAKIRLRDLATEFLQRVLCRTAKSPLSSEYQPSPRAALGSVCGPQPSGTAHPLHKRERKRETGREKKKTHEEHSTAQSHPRELEKNRRGEKTEKTPRRASSCK